MLYLEELFNNYFNIFLNKKYFKKKPLLQYEKKTFNLVNIALYVVLVK